jgi:hypothetical protein
VALRPFTCTPSCNIQLQRIWERACEVRLSAPLSKEPDVGLA